MKTTFPRPTGIGRGIIQHSRRSLSATAGFLTRTARCASLFLLLLCTLASTPLAAQTLTWSTGTAMNSTRSYAAAVVLNDGKVLVTGGNGASGILSTADLYNPATGTWTTVNMVAARWLHRAEKLADGRVLVMGGCNPGRTPLNTAEIYDPATGTFSAVANLAESRETFASTVLSNGKVLVHGGWVGGSVRSSGEVYDPATNTWTATGASVPRNSHELVTLPNGKVLMISGHTGAVHGPPECYLYDPAANTWATTGSMGTGRAGPRSVVLANGKVLTTGESATCELYDPATGTWSYTGSMSVGRGRGHAIPLGDGRVLAFGGVGSFPAMPVSSEIYNPTTGTWSATGSAASGRTDGVAVRLQSGDVLAAGGAVGTSVFSAPASANVAIFAGPEIVYPVLAWTNGTPLNAGGMLASIALLDNGHVLVMGGLTQSGTIATAQRYNPTTQTWTAINMVEARSRHTSEKLLDGRVLVMSGVVAGSYVNTTEIYDPTTDSFTAGPPLPIMSSGDVIASARLSNGKVLFFGGSTTRTGALYDPTTNTWISTPATLRRDMVGLEPLADGKALMFGGRNPDAGYSYQRESVIYDSTTNTWTASGLMNTAGGGYESIVLPNGKILSHFGDGNTYGAELYDPATGTWTNTGALVRGAGKLTQLADGRVLYAGGYANNYQIYVPETRIYNPANGTWSAGPLLSQSRVYPTLVTLNDGRALIAGGVISPFPTGTTSVEILDVANSAPTDIALSPSSIAENNAANATVGTLTATDADAGQTHTFSLVSGTGDTDNAAFNISSNALRLTGSADFETKSTYAIRIRATDGGGLTYEENFTVTITNETLTQTIIFSALAGKTFGDAPFAVSAMGGASGQPVTYSIVSGPATIAGNTVTLTGSGLVTVRASQAGAGDYGAAASVEQSFSVAQAAQSISFTNPGAKTFGDAPFTVSATGGAGGEPVTFSIASGPASIAGSLVTITGAGDVTVRASQAGTGDYAAATPVEQTFTVAKAAQSITFTAPSIAGTTDTVTLSATGGASGNAVTFSVFSGPGSLAGDVLTFSGVGTVVVRASQAGDANYEAAANVDATINVVLNAPPVALDDAVSITTGDATVYPLANDSDADLQTLTITAVSEGSVTIDGRTLIVPAGYTGTFSYTVSDGISRDTANVVVTTATSPRAPTLWSGLFYNSTGAISGRASLSSGAGGVNVLSVRLGSVLGTARFGFPDSTNLSTTAGIAEVTQTRDGRMSVTLSGGHTASLRPAVSSATPATYNVAVSGVSTSIPGSGFGTVKVTATGKAFIAFILPDGRRLVTGSEVADNGTLTLFGIQAQPGTSAPGYIGGELVLANLAATDLTGELEWKKAPVASGMHRTGVNAVLTVNGSAFNGILGIPDGTATVTYSGANYLAPVTFASTVVAGKVNPVAGKLISWRIHPVTKTFSIQLRDPATRRLTVANGIYLPKAGKAVGFFNGSNVGGKVEVTTP